ncbi:cell wall-active antibiotics response protein LiaF [Rummeliibacillus pycnus]|uniref:cell wall-active antibiotics response protein LiaF n=1 Tax=Rummeliibacillus pycnus TaxID=101070 RepID=UPI000C9C68B5|nr:cell wall-active antibiotics response protein LiaF [Rummeliibacillus pycnus]
MTHFSTNKISMMVITAILLIFIEATFFENGSIMFAIFGAFFIYISMRKRRKWLFWVGVCSLVIALMSMWSLRIIVISTLIYVLWQMKKGDPIQVSFAKPVSNQTVDQPIKNKFFSFQSTPLQSYEWQDVHIQSLVGDLYIDTTQTVLPKGTSLISIRQGFGKVKIIVPYEIPVRLHYNAFVGDASCFGEIFPRIWYDTISLRDGYEYIEDASTELIITVSTFLGDVEVIRQ